jgi:hypothetical protein
MIEIEQPIENVESWDPGSGGLVPIGIYEVRIEGVEVKTATSGYPNLNLRTKVVEGPHIGGTIFASRSLHPNALGFFRGMLDLLNCFATGKNIDEQKLVGRFMKLQVIEYTKNDNSIGTKGDKMFMSDINAAKNDQIDITAHGKAGTTAGAARPTNGDARKTGAATGSRRASGPHEGAPAPSQAPPAKEDDLPF